jgi:hypothetical protein
MGLEIKYMAKITISELRIADSERFINDLTDIDSMYVYGGEGYQFYQLLSFSLKTLEFVFLAFAIDTISSLAKLFVTNNRSFYNR